MSLLQIGVIGCGRIAREVHLRVLKNLPDVRVVALAEADAGALQSASSLAPDAKCYSEASELLADKNVQAVIIALPNALHAPLAIEAFRQAKHVYLEKPLGLNVEEGQKVVEAWRSAGTLGAMGFNYRFNPLLLQTKAQLQAQAIGRLIAVRSSFCAPLGQVPAWKVGRASGGGVLFDLASHHLDLLGYLTGQQVKAVWAQNRSFAHEDDTASIELQLQDGTLVQGFFSQSATERDLWEFEGEKGRLRVDRYSMSEVEITRPGELGIGARINRAKRAIAPHSVAQSIGHTRLKLREPNNEPSYRVALGHFVRAAQGEVVDSLATPLDGLYNLEIIAALEKSIVSGSRVTM